MKRGREDGSDGAEGEIEYEKLRNARLAENQKRMEELGLLNLSKCLRESVRSPASSRASSRSPSSIPRLSTPAGPARRSSRLSGSPVISYAENVRTASEGKGKISRRASQAGTGGYQPEIYTEEDENLLGDFKEEWQLFVDGYDAKGVRIYDPVRGKTCHQCRQKTMGHRTSCSNCQSLHGQFCGDCLYMRYGENVLEANQNPVWECPVCRNICNCSFCRLKRGWTPTGSLYRKIKSLGYKSVAHYLILTRRGDNEERAGVEVPSKSAGLMEKATDLDGETVASLEPITENAAKPCLEAPEPVVEKPGSLKRGQEAIKTNALSSVWRSRRAGSITSKGVKETIVKGTNVIEVSEKSESAETTASVDSQKEHEAEQPQEESKKPGRGRPRKTLPTSGKGSFYGTAPRRRVAAKPEPDLNSTYVKEEQEVLTLDSDTEDSSCDLKGGNMVPIAHRLRRRHVC